MIRLFDIQGGNIIPTEHCYAIAWLKRVLDNFPDQIHKVIPYIFYMSYIGKENPYFNIPEKDREEMVMKDLEIDFSVDDDDIQDAVKHAKQLYETPTQRAYKAIRKSLEDMEEYMLYTGITDGRDGNLTQKIALAEKFDKIRQSFKNTEKDLDDEQSSNTARGGQTLAYDQI